LKFICHENFHSQIELCLVCSNKILFNLNFYLLYLLLNYYFTRPKSQIFSTLSRTRKERRLYACWPASLVKTILKRRSSIFWINGMLK
jgi:hypothetical protein